MRKLRKKHSKLENSVEAYACNCRCWCGCDSSWLPFAHITNNIGVNTAAGIAGTGAGITGP